MKNSTVVLSALFFLTIACRNSTEPSIPVVARMDSAFGMVIADTIIYDVVIKNDNPDDTWAEERLKNLDHNLLIDSIFNMIYQQRVTAFDHITREKLTPAQVRKLEEDPGFKRDDISMIQFKEIWYLNPATTQMHKKVISMVLGAAVYTSMGEFKANRAIMRIEMN